MGIYLTCAGCDTKIKMDIRSIVFFCGAILCYMTSIDGQDCVQPCWRCIRSNCRSCIGHNEYEYEYESGYEYGSGIGYQYEIGMCNETCNWQCDNCDNIDQCTSCYEGYYLDINDMCQECNFNTCAVCSDSTTCLKCQVGNYLDAHKHCRGCKWPCKSCVKDKCTTCEPRGYYLDANYTCQRCAPHCALCSDVITCLICELGFYLDANNTCQGCGQCCEICSNATACLRCQYECYLGADNTCQNNEPPCDMCTEAPTSCRDGSYWDANNYNCQACTPNCRSCASATKCQLCRCGFNSYANITCQGCVPNCETYLDEETCLGCQPGYYLETDYSCRTCKWPCEYCTKAKCVSCANRKFYLDDNNMCQACAPNCQTCSDALTCLKCQDGFYQDANSICQACTPYCRTCSDAVTCVKCQHGFYRDANNACQEIDECESQNLCPPADTCTDLVNDYSCTCSPPFYQHVAGSNKDCSRVDVCSSSPCKNNGTCDEKNTVRFKCECPENFVGIFCETDFANTTAVDKAPNVVDLRPKQGPISGGSYVTLIGTNLDPVYPAVGAIFFDSSDLCPSLYSLAQLNRSDSNHLVLLTSRATECHVGRNMSVIVEFSGPSKQLPLTFTYLGNPAITDIQPRSLSITGGGTITVSGSNLHVVGDPKMTTTIEIRDENGYLDKRPPIVESCEQDGTRLMYCPFPLLNLPPGFETSKREGLAAATVRNGNQTANMYIGFVLDGFRKYSNTSRSNPNNPFTLVPININFNAFSSTLVYDPITRKPIVIPGNGFSKYGLSQRDYEMTIGTGVCTIDRFTDNQMTCNPPTEKPSADNLSISFCETDTLCLAALVSTKSYAIGCVQYRSGVEFEYLGLIGLVGLIVVVIAVIVIIIYVKKRTPSKKDNGINRPAHHPLKADAIQAPQTVYMDTFVTAARDASNGPEMATSFRTRDGCENQLPNGNSTGISSRNFTPFVDNGSSISSGIRETRVPDQHRSSGEYSRRLPILESDGEIEDMGPNARNCDIATNNDDRRLPGSDSSRRLTRLKDSHGMSNVDHGQVSSSSDVIVDARTRLPVINPLIDERRAAKDVRVTSMFPSFTNIYGSVESIFPAAE